MTSILTNAIKTAAIGGILGFGVGMVNGMVQKKMAPSDIPHQVGETKDVEIEQLGHQLHDYGDSRKAVQLMYQLASLEQAELSMSLPKEAHALKHAIEVEVGKIAEDTSPDRQDKLKDTVAEIMEFVNGRVMNLTFDVQGTMD